MLTVQRPWDADHRGEDLARGRLGLAEHGGDQQSYGTPQSTSRSAGRYT
jgi:hypothetical protein